MNVRLLTLLLASLLATTALAGCADTADDTTGDEPLAGDNETPGDVNETPDDTTETPDDANETPTEGNETGAYALTVDGVPSMVTAGNVFTFNLNVDGPLGNSTHIGAHYADNDTTDPAASAMLGCDHVQGDLPGTVVVSCKIDEGGVWHVFGHVATGSGDSEQHYWAEPITVTAYDYDVVLEQVADSGLTANFTLNITGAPASETNHAGAHWSRDANVTLAASAMDGGCTHPGVEAPSTFEFSCTFPEAGTYYVFGHYRLSEERAGTWIEDFWSSPIVVTVEAAE